MEKMLASPSKSLIAGVALTLILAGAWLASDGVGLPEVDLLGWLSFLLRWLHVLSGIVWVGLVFFVNFVQLIAMYEADETGRAFIGKTIGLRTSWWFRQASHLSVATGIALLLMMGYLFPSLIFGSSIFVPGVRTATLWTGVIGGLAMWAFVHMVIWPNLQVMSGARPGDDAAKAKARIKVRNFARLNLILSIPVTFAMVAVAHL